MLAVLSLAFALGCTGDASAPSPRPSAPADLEAAPAPVLIPPSLARPTPPPPLEGDAELVRVADPWHPLPAGYVPPDLATLPASLGAPGYGTFELRREAAEGLRGLLDAARPASHDLRVVSAYRSYDTQVAIFERRTASVGEVCAARGSARPGHREHQLGTTVDLSSAVVEWRLTQRFGDTEAGRWLAERAHEHGWALSYPAGKEDVTGYIYEPWHARYLGVTYAPRWRASGLTVTEYLQSSGGPGGAVP